VSFGGTQGVLDRIEGQVDVDGIAGALEKVTGVSLDGVLEALTGEGVLFVRPGEELPEVTLVLRPPNADETWPDVDRLIRGLADDAGATVTTSTENGVAVSRATAEGTTVRWARPEPGLVVVTTGTDVAVLSEGGETLAETDAFEAAAEAAGLGERTKGFAYVDVDGLLPVVERAAGTDVPPDLEQSVGAVDAVLLQASGDGDTTRVSGFVRIPD